MSETDLPVLMKVSEWRARRFSPNSAPDVKTIKKWIDQQIIPGKVIGRNYYVDLGEELRKTGDPTVDQILADVEQEQRGKEAS